jgi:hypothetical protein
MGTTTASTIPAGMITIGSSAFQDRTDLTSIIIPDSVNSIGYSAFYGCTGLSSINIPAGVSSIGYLAFHGCNFNSITVADGNTTYKAEGNCLTEISTKTLVKGTNTSIIPGDVTIIYTYAFKDCTDLTSITIPDSVTTIYGEAFSYCTALTSITLPDSVTTIGLYAFSGCSNLAEVIINAVTPPTISSNPFNYTHASLQIKVPADSLAAYQETNIWSELPIVAQ